MIADNPIMAGGKQPSGRVNVTENDIYDVARKAGAVVNAVSAPVLLKSPSPSSYLNAGTANNFIGALNRIGTKLYTWSRQITAVYPDFIAFHGGSWFSGGCLKSDGRYARPTRIWGAHFTVV